jgi:hypothetical protein
VVVEPGARGSPAALEAAQIAYERLAGLSAGVRTLSFQAHDVVSVCCFVGLSVLLVCWFLCEALYGRKAAAERMMPPGEAGRHVHVTTFCQRVGVGPHPVCRRAGSWCCRVHRWLRFPFYVLDPGF